MVTLDFEKPIEALENKLAEIRSLGTQNNVDVSASVLELEKKILELKQNIYSGLSSWQRVQLARHPERPYTLDYIEGVFDEFSELHGDRAFGDDKAMVGGLARIADYDVVVVGQQKGRDTKSRQYRNFGMANPEGYRKALRLMKLAEKFNKPVITFIDTPGAFPGLEAEERGQAEAIARNLLEMSVLKVPIICIIIGEGASGGALGIGIGDKVYMLENTWYSVISPESCSSILWRNWDHKEEAANALRLTAQDNLELGLVDGILPEPMGGAHRDPAAMFATVRTSLLKDLAKLSKTKADALVKARIEKFSGMGAVTDLSAPAARPELETAASKAQAAKATKE